MNDLPQASRIANTTSWDWRRRYGDLCGDHGTYFVFYVYRMGTNVLGV